MSVGSPASAQNFVSGGYFIARLAHRVEHMSADLLPDTLLTASGCIVDLVPDTWAIAWTGDTPERRRQEAALFGLDENGLCALTDWCTAALEAGSLGWPGVFLDVETATHVRARLFPSSAEIVLFGIALPADLRDVFLDETRPGPREGTPGVVQALEANTPPDGRGRVSGFDVLGWDYGGFHSYICNGLETEFGERLGVTPNVHGFFDSEQDARRCAQHAGLETTGAEPALWLPWQVLLYDW